MVPSWLRPRTPLKEPPLCPAAVFPSWFLKKEALRSVLTEKVGFREESGQQPRGQPETGWGRELSGAAAPWCWGAGPSGGRHAESCSAPGSSVCAPGAGVVDSGLHRSLTSFPETPPRERCQRVSMVLVSKLQLPQLQLGIPPCPSSSRYPETT